MNNIATKCIRGIPIDHVRNILLSIQNISIRIKTAKIVRWDLGENTYPWLDAMALPFCADAGEAHKQQVFNELLRIGYPQNIAQKRSTYHLDSSQKTRKKKEITP